MKFIIYILFAIYIFGSWSITKQHKILGTKKGACIAGLIISVVSLITAIVNIKNCFYAFSVVERIESGIGSDMYYAFSSGSYGPNELWTHAFLYMIVFVPFGIVSLFAIKNYYNALFKKEDNNILDKDDNTSSEYKDLY